MESEKMERREFLQAGMMAGAGLWLAGCGRSEKAGPAAAAAAAGKRINVGLIGFGAQGQILLTEMLKIPELNFVAVCDIWDYHRTRGQRTLQGFKFQPNAYEDYREMLAKEKDLDAVVVATPDFFHAEHTNACLKAGKHVYCEKMMSNTIEGARSMVQTMRETGKLLQIGHQRRSSPQYRYVREELLGKLKLLGRIMNANAQWNRSLAGSQDIGFPEKFAMSPEKLAQYGFANMYEFRNWRWFRKYSGGPISDLGAHQIDIFNWFLDAHPRSVVASGGNDYFNKREWYDNVMVIYEYDTAAGPARAFYQVLTTTSAGGYFETFMGTEGTAKMCEDQSVTRVYREANAPEWQQHVDDEKILKVEVPEVLEEDDSADPGAGVVDVRQTEPLSSYVLPVTLDMKPHYYHLKNFFDAVQGKAALNCPADEAFRSEMAVFKVNEAVEARRVLELKPADFEV